MVRCGLGEILDLILLFIIACISSAATLILDEIYDARTNPEHGLKWSDFGKKSHETVIIILLAIAVLIGYSSLLLSLLGF